MRVLSLLAASAYLCACGPTRSQSRIVEASSELSAATKAQGDQIAPYEFTAAEQYLRKAREEQSYAEYEVAERLAKRGRDCAKLARMRAESGARAELGASDIEIPASLKCTPGPAGTQQMATRPKDKKGPATPVAPADAKRVVTPKDKAPASGEPKDPEDTALPPGELPDGEDSSGGGK